MSIIQDLNKLEKSFNDESFSDLIISGDFTTFENTKYKWLSSVFINTDHTSAGLSYRECYINVIKIIKKEIFSRAFSDWCLCVFSKAAEFFYANNYIQFDKTFFENYFSKKETQYVNRISFENHALEGDIRFFPPPQNSTDIVFKLMNKDGSNTGVNFTIVNWYI